MATGAPPYTFVIRKKTGTQLWYFRHADVAGTPRLPGRPGEVDFHRRYTALLEAATQAQAAHVQLADPRTMRWLVEQFRESAEWEELSGSTKRSYDSHLDRLNTMAGDLPFAKLTSGGLLAMRKRVKEEVTQARKAAAQKRAESDLKDKEAGRTPKRNPPKVTTGSRTADLFKSVVSTLLSWAVEHEHLEENPTLGTRRLQKKRNVVSHNPWTEKQIQGVLASAPQPIKDGVIAGLYTGQRLADCLRMHTGKEQCDMPIVRVRQAKTGNLVDIQAAGPLAELIERRKTADDKVHALVLRDDGLPYSERLFSEHLRDFLDSLGYTDISFHGLRYAAAGTLNEAGCTVATIVSIIGHSTYQTAVQYLTARENAAHAASAMNRASANRASGVQTAFDNF